MTDLTLTTGGELTLEHLIDCRGPGIQLHCNSDDLECNGTYYLSYDEARMVAQTLITMADEYDAMIKQNKEMIDE